MNKIHIEALYVLRIVDKFILKYIGVKYMKRGSEAIKGLEHGTVWLGHVAQGFRRRHAQARLLHVVGYARVVSFRSRVHSSAGLHALRLTHFLF